MRSKAIITAILLAGLSANIGCSVGSTEQPAPPPTRVITKYVVNSHEAPNPAGVERYCWEEPQAQRAQMGPGLDEEGRWYHPSYGALRQVRGGRWHPCRVKSSSTSGAQYSTEFTQGE